MGHPVQGDGIRRDPAATAGPTKRASVRDAAIRLLAGREHSRFELRRKLLARRHAAADIDRVLDALAADGLQSDDRFAESYVRSCLGRGQGPLKIRASLKQRGIDDDLAAAAVDLDDGDWRALAEAARGKRFGSAPPEDRRQWAKQARFLAGRGFPSDIVGHVLRDAAEF